MSTNVQVAVMPVISNELGSKIAIGFHSEHFSQCVYIPYENHDAMVSMAKELSQAITDASKAILDKKFIPSEE